jgi:BirA family transcriptional regulator, biotin operon repressor / biotin---[acetyl-CoA-carboxylase] ligase
MTSNTPERLSAVILSEHAASTGYRLHHLPITTSTHDEAYQLALKGDTGNVWVVADTQTQGRGRHGRVWESPKGNLFASLLLINPCDPALAAQLGFVAGLGVHDAMLATTSITSEHIKLKWPNDVLLDKAKGAGVLLEGHRLHETKTFAVIVGFGVNISTPPQETPYPATYLNAYDQSVTRDALFATLSDVWVERYRQWYDPRQGFASLRSDWLKRAAGVGDVITIRSPQGEKRGIFQGLDAYGRLELCNKDTQTVEYIDAGDVFL